MWIYTMRSKVDPLKFYSGLLNMLTVPWNVSKEKKNKNKWKLRLAYLPVNDDIKTGGNIYY